MKVEIKAINTAPIKATIKTKILTALANTNHNELKNLDFDTSGHIGFASQQELDKVKNELNLHSASSCFVGYGVAGEMILDIDIRGELNNKVDKVEGKGLSTSDFTNEEKAFIKLIMQESSYLEIGLVNYMLLNE